MSLNPGVGPGRGEVHGGRTTSVTLTREEDAVLERVVRAMATQPDAVHPVTRPAAIRYAVRQLACLLGVDREEVPT